MSRFYLQSFMRISLFSVPIGSMVYLYCYRSEGFRQGENLSEKFNDLILDKTNIFNNNLKRHKQKRDNYRDLSKPPRWYYDEWS